MSPFALVSTALTDVLQPKHLVACLAAFVYCFALGGCDQFARVGTVNTAGAGGAPPRDVPRDAEPEVQNDGGTTKDAGVRIDASMPVIADASVLPDAGSRCASPSVAVCNPVTNEGCPDLLRMQCAADFAATALAGYCLFSAPFPMDVGMPCVNTLVTESCPARSTCVVGECRTLCFCDSDCEDGGCCGEPIGDFGFKVCTRC